MTVTPNGRIVDSTGKLSFRELDYSPDIFFVIDREHSSYPDGVTFHPEAPIFINEGKTCPTRFRNDGQFSHLALSDDLLCLHLLNKNSDKKIYTYALRFIRKLSNGPTVVFDNDPEMENGGGGTGLLGGEKRAGDEDDDDDDIMMVEFPVRLRRRRRRDEAEGADDE